jgi:hypothetical protein
MAECGGRHAGRMLRHRHPARRRTRLGPRTGVTESAESGAVSFPQRFGGSLNLHVHFHTLAVDGLFENQEGGVRVYQAPPPEKADLDHLLRRVHARTLIWLRRHRYLDERPADERGNAPGEQAPLDAFAVLALAGGSFTGRPSMPEPADHAAFENKQRRFSASHAGFDVHCAVRIGADDDIGRERLIRYCARPPFALERIEPMKFLRPTSR